MTDFIDIQNFYTNVVPKYGFPLRQGQQELSEKINEAFRTGKIIIAEAGSDRVLAYLLPAVNRVLNVRAPALIATAPAVSADRLRRQEISQLGKILIQENLLKRSLVAAEFRQNQMKAENGCDFMICLHRSLLLRLRAGGNEFLSQFSGLIIDEAHMLEDNIYDTFCINEECQSFTHFFQKVLKFAVDSSNRSLMKKYCTTGMEMAKEMFGEMERMKIFIRNTSETGHQYNVAVTPALAGIADQLKRMMTALLHRIHADTSVLQAFDTNGELCKEYRRLLEFLTAVCHYRQYIWWAQADKSHFSVTCVPKDISSKLFPVLYTSEIPILMTSPTLSVILNPQKPKPNFECFTRGIGLTGSNANRCSEPLRTEQTHDDSICGLVYLEKKIQYFHNGKSSDYTEYLKKLAEEIRLIAAMSQGRTMIVFTSSEELKFTFNLVVTQLKQDNEIPCYISGQPKAESLFESNDRSCLFKTVSEMRSGFTYPSLSVLVIHRLPFSASTQPNLFKSDKPQCGKKVVMLTMLRQISENLINSEAKNKMLAILDSRASGHEYDKLILQNLPPFRRIRNLNIAEQLFLK